MKSLLSGIGVRLLGIVMLIDWHNVLSNPKSIGAALLIAIGTALKAYGDAQSAQGTATKP